MSRIYLVGIGPGNREHMTEAAFAAMEKSDILCGYTVYIKLVQEHFPDKETYTTSMRQEIERCQWAVEQAEAGKTVAMLCSGDAGVYGMAGLVIQLAEGKDIDIEVVPGVTAATSGAAVLGAPLMHDFCVISLSDLLTPWDLILKRLRLAAEGDFSIVLYNPRSKHRPEHLHTACETLMEVKSPDTVCGWVKNIGRDGEECGVLTLKELADSDVVDMFTTVFIGGSGTQVIDGRMVTPRGYEAKL